MWLNSDIYKFWHDIYHAGKVVTFLDRFCVSIFSNSKNLWMQNLASVRPLLTASIIPSKIGNFGRVLRKCIPYWPWILHPQIFWIWKNGYAKSIQKSDHFSGMCRCHARIYICHYLITIKLVLKMVRLILNVIQKSGIFVFLDKIFTVRPLLTASIIPSKIGNFGRVFRECIPYWP